MPSKVLRLKVARFRARRRAHQQRIDPGRWICIDVEADKPLIRGIKTNMTLIRDSATGGQRLTAHAPH